LNCYDYILLLPGLLLWSPSRISFLTQL
jgi:hypothetical protein